MFAAALAIQLHVPHAHSLKEKRAVVKPIVEGARHRFAVASAEVGQHDRWQRAELAFAAVGASEAHVEEVLDRVEKFVWSFPEVEVLDAQRHWLEVAG